MHRDLPNCNTLLDDFIFVEECFVNFITLLSLVNKNMYGCTHVQLPIHGIAILFYGVKRIFNHNRKNGYKIYLKVFIFFNTKESNPLHKCNRNISADGRHSSIFQNEEMFFQIDKLEEWNRISPAY